MNKKTNHTGFAIAVAWPETYCKQPGYWYDKILSFLGINKNHYYKAGHAALVLINKKNKRADYFDFGRYHTPFQHGRVRSSTTDNGLLIKTIPKLSQDGEKIENYREILNELQNNSECHGEGKLYASYCTINYNMAFSKVMELQAESPIPYGPFRRKGSNCSRFVNTSILSGKPDWKLAFRLKYLVPFTPTPLNNANSLMNKKVLLNAESEESFYPEKITDKKILKETLRQPQRHPNIPKQAQWLSGEGAGSWYYIENENNKYFFKRYNPQGELECNGEFKIINNIDFNINSPFKFIYLSHCNKFTIQQNNKIFEFIRVI